MSYPHPLSLPLSRMTTIFLLSLWKSFHPSKPNTAATSSKRPCLIASLATKWLLWRKTEGRKVTSGVKKCPGNLKSEPRKCSLFFLILSHSGLRWEAQGLSVLIRHLQSAFRTPQGTVLLREGQRCSHLHLQGDRPASPKPSSHHLWMWCPRWPPRQWLIPRALGCILLISACFPMVGEGAGGGGGRQRCHIWPVILPQVSEEEGEHHCSSEDLWLPSPLLGDTEAPSPAQAPQLSRLPVACICIESNLPYPLPQAQPSPFFKPPT